MEEDFRQYRLLTKYYYHLFFLISLDRFFAGRHDSHIMCHDNNFSLNNCQHLWETLHFIWDEDNHYSWSYTKTFAQLILPISAITLRWKMLLLELESTVT